MKTLAHSENAASLKGIHILLLDLCSHLPPAFKDVKNASSASGSRPPLRTSELCSLLDLLGHGNAILMDLLIGPVTYQSL